MDMRRCIVNRTKREIIEEIEKIWNKQGVKGKKLYYKTKDELMNILSALEYNELETNE
jgi:hypothetical protein